MALLAFLLLISTVLGLVNIPFERISNIYLIDIGLLETSLTNLANMNTKPNAENLNSMQYRAKVQVGTPSSEFAVMLDTQSSWIWVPSIKCMGICHSPSNYFNASDSESYKSLNQEKEIKSEIGHVKGELSLEKISIGDTVKLTVTDQPFILVNDEKDGEGLKVDGISGLAFNMHSDEYPNLLDSLKEQGQIDKKIFSLYLDNNNFDKGPTESSEIIFGGYDLEKYALNSEIKYVDVKKETGLWAASLSSVKIGKTNLHSSSKTVIIDTGSSLITAPKNDWDKIFSKLQSRWNCRIASPNYCLCDCENEDAIWSFPTIYLTLDYKKFSLKPEDYFLKQGSQCLLLIEKSDAHDEWVLGDAFLRKYYTIFDAEEYRIGFAHSKGNQSTVSVKEIGLIIAVTVLLIFCIYSIASHYKNEHRVLRGIVTAPYVRMYN